ncbi:MAG: thermonuclease family protein [Nanoarchaeota archaeon]|nr:thermonuclease family protein [Nanoarchaeota archaeon]
MKIITILLLILLVSGCVNEPTGFYVTRVIDGDTFVISTGEHIRIQGIDAPDKNDYYYYEATQRLKELIEFKTVTLERDNTNKDRYGRLLRYVYLGNKMIDAQMLEEGYAKVFIFEADKKYEKVLIYAQNYAKNNHLGVWNNDN